MERYLDDNLFGDELGQAVLSILQSLNKGMDMFASSERGDHIRNGRSNVDQFEDVRSQEGSEPVRLSASNRRNEPNGKIFSNSGNNSQSDASEDVSSDDVPAFPGDVFEEPGIFEGGDGLLDGVSFEVAEETDLDLNAIRDMMNAEGSDASLDSKGENDGNDSEDDDFKYMEGDDSREEEYNYSAQKRNRQFPGAEVLNSMYSTGSELNSSMGQRSDIAEDEWENDDDTGYIIVTVSAEDFFEMEEEAISQLAREAEIKDEVTALINNLSLHPTVTDETDHRVPIEEDLANVESIISHRETEPTKVDSDVPPPPPPSEEQAAESGRPNIFGQSTFIGADNVQHSFFNLKVIFEPYKTGFEETKHFEAPKGTIIAGRYEVTDFLGQAAFSSALQCVDLCSKDNDTPWVCLKVIKNSKDFFDQSMDEIKLLQYINSKGDPNKHHVLQLIDFFYYKEHLFIVSELLRENLYEFGRYVKESGLEPYYTIPRLKKIMKQVLEALQFIHSLNLVHCDIKPENIVIKSYSRCEIKLIDFGSSCFTSDHLSTYIQSRSYRAPEVIIGHHYDTRIDIWSIGAVLAELHTGYVLFQNDSVATMLARITGVLGSFPAAVLSAGRETKKYFTSAGVCYESVEDVGYSLIYPKKTTLAARLHLDSNNMTADDELFLDFVRQSLDLDPKSRPGAEKLLRHGWLEGADELQIPAPVLTQPPPAPADFIDEDDNNDDEDDSLGEEGEQDESEGVEDTDEDEQN